MKLRIRSLESKETLKIETPNPSSLQNLKDAIAQKISASSQTLHLSLNRKDAIIASPMDSLNSLGIASGDLIYYTQNPNGFSEEAPIQPQVETHPIQASIPEQTLEIKEIFDNPCTSVVGIQTLDQENETLDSDEGVDEESRVLVRNLSSVPSFLQKVYKEEMGYGNTQGDHKLLIIAVHAVFLESGFVCFDAVTKKKIEGFRLPEGWASKSTVSVRYTVPDLLDSRDEGMLATVDLKFQTMGKFVCVHGSLSRQNPVGSFKLDGDRFVPSVNFVCMLDCDLQGGEKEVGGSLKSHHEKEVFELWKIAKDGLALPLLIDLCDKTGLEPPPCFMCLPTELKLKILELLPGVDIAKVGCVSSELRYLSSNNELWKQKYTEEFSLSDSGETAKDHWKEKYIVSRERKKRKRRPSFVPYPLLPQFPPMRRQPRPFFGFPGMIGGDQDRFPAPFGNNQILRFPARRNFTLHCNLDGFDA